MLRAVFTLLLATAPLTAQDPLFRGSLGISGGSYRFDSDLPGFNERADTGLFQVEFEAAAANGYGGGFRFESFTSDDDDGLFRIAGDPLDRGTRASGSTFQAHFTYLIRQHRFEMPLRAGLMLNGLVLEDQGAPDPETSYGSFGPFAEIEPEITLSHHGATTWSAYGLFGFGVTGTEIEVDGDPRDYRSDSGFVSVEVGTRLTFGYAEIGIALFGRYQSMDPSSIEDGQFLYGFDGGYEGVLLTAGVRF